MFGMNLQNAINLDLNGGRVSPIGRGIRNLVDYSTAFSSGEDYRTAVRSRSPAPHSPDSLTRIGVFHFTPKESVKCVPSVKREGQKKQGFPFTSNQPRLLLVLRSIKRQAKSFGLTKVSVKCFRLTNIFKFLVLIILIGSKNLPANTINPIPIVVHHTASTHMSLAECRQWHVVERGWDDCGYHFIIQRDGQVDKARPFGTKGAHAKGSNHLTGIVFVANGLDPEWNITEAQAIQFWKLHKQLGSPKVIGHRDTVGAHTHCPTDLVWNKLHSIKGATHV